MICSSLFGSSVKNFLIVCFLFNTISKEFSNSLFSFQNASEISSDLRSCFLESDRPRVFEIKKSLATLLHGSMDVNTNYIKMKMLRDKLDGYEEAPACTCIALHTWTSRQ